VQEFAVATIQFDDQPPKVLPEPGVAVRVTVVPTGKLPVQVLPVPQLIGGAGVLVTSPVAAPFPTLYTSSVGRVTGPMGTVPLPAAVKVAAPMMSEPSVLVPIAVIAEVPAEFAVARPAELIVATFTSLETHVTEFVTSCIAGVTPVKVPMAMYCDVSPKENTV
jgi:hypothetical protein